MKTSIELRTEKTPELLLVPELTREKFALAGWKIGRVYVWRLHFLDCRRTLTLTRWQYATHPDSKTPMTLEEFRNHQAAMASITAVKSVAEKNPLDARSRK